MASILATIRVDIELRKTDSLQFFLRDYRRNLQNM